MRLLARLTTLMTLATATAAVSAALVSAVPAQAEVRTSQDGRGDVTTFGDPDFPGRPGVKRSVDVVGLTGDHGSGRLRFVVDVADLTLNGNEEVTASVRFVTTGGRDWTTSVARGPLSPGPKQVTLAETGAEPGAQPTACDGLQGRALPRADRFVLVVPRSCVRSPAGVRYGAGVRMTDLNSGNPNCCPNSYADDARRARSDSPTIRLGATVLANN